MCVRDYKMEKTEDISRDDVGKLENAGLKTRESRDVMYVVTSVMKTPGTLLMQPACCCGINTLGKSPDWCWVNL